MQMDRRRPRRARDRGVAALAAACALAAAAVPGVVGAQDPGGPSPYAQATPTPIPSPAPADSPVREAAEPRLRRRAVLVPLRGRVLYRPRGVKRHRRLTQRVDVAFGVDVDARRGRVRVVVERDARGRRSRATFYDGRFVLSQSGRPAITTLRLAGGRFADRCSTASASARRRKRRVRRLWGDGKGRFRTRGRYSAATVRGTKWLVEDRCEGTLTRVARGEVEVEVFGASEQAPEGQQEVGGEQPAARAPAPSRRVVVGEGGSYVAGPGD